MRKRYYNILAWRLLFQALNPNQPVCSRPDFAITGTSDAGLGDDWAGLDEVDGDPTRAGPRAQTFHHSIAARLIIP